MAGVDTKRLLMKVISPSHRFLEIDEDVGCVYKRGL